MILIKTYSGYHVAQRIIDQLIAEFLSMNGFELKSLVHGSQQTDSRSHLQLFTLVYDDLGKRRVFNNDYDEGLSRMDNDRLQLFRQKRQNLFACILCDTEMPAKAEIIEHIGSHEIAKQHRVD